MKLGIFAKTFTNLKPNKLLKVIAKNGYSTAHYNMTCSGLESVPDYISERILNDIKNAIKNNAIDICSLSGTYNIVHPNKKIKIKGEQNFKILASLATKIPVKLITLCTGTKNSNDQWCIHKDNNLNTTWKEMLNSIERLILIAEKHDIILGIEPELGNIVNSPDKALKLINEIQSSKLKIIIDPANLFKIITLNQQHNLISKTIDLLSENIIMAHAKDRNSDGDFTTVGKGIIDFNHYLTCLKKINFDGPIIAHGFQSDEALDVSFFLKNILENLEIKV